MMNRRRVLRTGCLWLAGMAVSRIGWGMDKSDVVEISMRTDPSGSHVFFDPIGLLVRPGQRVRWVNEGPDVHTTTAYHPDNSQHPLRIPAAAIPWDSGYLVNPGDQFEVRLTIEGVYDYYCTPHEMAGMVGRIIVASTAGTPSNSFDPYPDDPGNPLWKKLPDATLRNFPEVESILNKGEISTH